MQFEFSSTSIYGIICSLTLILTDAWFIFNLKVALTTAKALNYDRIENVQSPHYKGDSLTSTCFHVKHQIQGKLQNKNKSNKTQEVFS